MQVTRTHNAYHLGDNLVHLHFLRKIALVNPDRQFVHYAQWQYLRQLKDVIADTPNIKLEVFGHTLPNDSINAWRGEGNFWYGHPDRNDFVKFHVESWFPYLAGCMKVANPIKTAADMLFDYPAIQKPFDEVKKFDVLVVNSPPGSGQFSGYNEFAIGELAKRIYHKGFSAKVTHRLPSNDVPSTEGLSVTQIGQLSLHCHTILMVSTGPSWPTWNIWNTESVKHRIILIDSERINLSPNTEHTSSIEESADMLKSYGLL